METALYRHFDAEGRLLYVGISLNAFSRLMQHRRDSAWFRQIASITVEWFPTRGKAVDAERAAIQAERPLHNVIHVLPDFIVELMNGPKGYMLDAQGIIRPEYASLTTEEAEALADRLAE